MNNRQMRNGIMKTGQNCFSILINAGRDPATGKRIMQWVSFKGTFKEAQQKRVELLHQLNTGNFARPTKTKVAEFLRRWIDDYKPNLSPRGYDRYEGIINRHLIPALGHLTLTQLKPEHISKHYTDLLNRGLAPKTVKYHHSVLHNALKTALKWGLIMRNPSDAVTPPRGRQSEMQTWNEIEMTRFLKEAESTSYYELFYLALFTGMRRSELLALRWSNIDFIYDQIYVNRGLHHLKNGSYVFTEPKSQKSRRAIALSPSTVLLLKALYDKQAQNMAMLRKSLNDDDLVFCHLDGVPLRPNTITRAWVVTAQKAGVNPIRLHDARHTHASLLLKQGIHPKIVQERLGHSSIEITLDTYSHVAPGLQAAAAARFDEAFINNRINTNVPQHQN